MKRKITKIKGIGSVVENPTKKDDGFQVLNMSLLNLQVCSKLPQEEIETAVNTSSPSGTSNGWRLETEGNLAPVACADDPLSKHYLFSC